ncbi:MAG: ABC transporter permease subunit [Desulfurococcales archaeon]|jgi:ABC-2 type transport system permease protein|nr:ABC transporter permease subunit [Desulfurococcales archaeon]
MLRTLVKKEIKDLIRDPRIWIPVLIGFLVLPIFGLIQNISISTQISQGYARQISAQIAVLDNQGIARDFLEILKASMMIYNISYVNREDAFPREADALIVINASSIESLAHGGRVETYIFYKTELASFSTGQGISFRIEQAIIDASRIYVAKMKNLTSILPTLIYPSKVYSIPYIQGRNAVIASFDANQIFILTFIPIMVPLIFLLISISILQYSSVSMAVENEEKTLEVLLSMPIPRRDIVLAKLAASGFIGALSLAGFGLGLLLYTEMLTSSISSFKTLNPNITQGLAPQYIGVPPQIIHKYLQGVKIQSIYDLISLSPQTIVVIVIYALEAILIAGIIGIVIGGASSDVRMATTISGSITPALVILWLAMGFIDPSSLSARVLLSNPLTGLPFYSRIAMLEGYSSPDIYIYLVISGLEAIAITIIAGNTLNIEKLERLKKGLSIFRKAN